MKKILITLIASIALFYSADAQIDSTRVIDNKGTIKYVVKNNGAILTLKDSTEKYVTPKQLVDSLKKQLDTAGNGLTKNGKMVELGGSLTRATEIDVNGQVFSIVGLTEGASDDSLIVFDKTTKALKKLSVTGLFKVGNGLTKSGDSIILGGTLDRPTEIKTNATNTLTLDATGLNITNLSSGTANDSLLVVDPATGKVRRIATSLFKTLSGNGLTAGESGDSVVLGGTLDRPTTIKTDGQTFTIETAATNDSFVVKGKTVLDGTTVLKPLTQGEETDSVVVRDPATGELKVVSASTLLKNLKALNGLTKSNDTIYLGGDLTRNTNVSTAGKTLEFTQTGANDSIKFTGIQSGNTATDSFLMINGQTGRLTRVSATGSNNTKSYTINSGLPAAGSTTPFTIAQATSTIPANYKTSQVWVYRNGAKLVAGVDYEVVAGVVTITPQTTNPNDSWEWGAYERIELQWVQ
jgi:hypothetical protein